MGYIGYHYIFANTSYESICNDKIYDRALLGLDHKFVSFIKSLLYSYNVGEAACATSLASSLEICTININRLLLLSKCKNFFGIFGVQSFRLIEIIYVLIFCSNSTTNHFIKCHYMLKFFKNIIILNNLSLSLVDFLTLNSKEYWHNINVALIIYINVAFF